jgi:filamentous hemagglutinin family protein
MNKFCYRIVFNKARGQLMAVAETALADHGGIAGGKGHPHRSPSANSTTPQGAGLALKALAAALFAGVFMGGPLQAQIIADPSAPANQRPTILSDGTRPLINIQSPSGAGVSRNTYSQFDVQSNGVILNNSRASNPWLATGEARVILNEINSSNPSYLRGQVAVNGGSAQVLIANPSGLKIDGGSFVNASRVTLSTGTSVMEGGALKAMRVERGAVEIIGAGLNVQGVPYTEILSRTAALNAKITGSATGEINITTGSQTVDYASGQLTAQTPTSPAPALAIDAAALGGMYAGRISLLATEAGVGVRNAGGLQAVSQLILTADGQLSHTGNITAPVVSLGTVTGDIVQSGQLQATNAALLSAGGNLRVSGQGLAQTAGSAVVLSAQKGIALESNANVSSTASGGQVTLSARESVQLGSGSTVAGQAGVTISSDAQVQATGAQLSSNGGGVNLLAGSGLSLANSRIDAASIQFETGKALAETNAPISLNANNLNATGSLTVLATGNLNSSGNSLSAGGHLHMGSALALSTSNDRLRAGSIEMIGSSTTAKSLDAAASSWSLKISSTAGGVDISGTAYQASTLSASTDLQITALGGDARLAAVNATADNVKVNATGNTQLISAIDSATGGKFTRELRTALTARKSLSLATVGTGKVLALGTSNLQAATEDLSLTSAGSISMGYANVSATQGSISAVSAGTITGVGNAVIRAGQNLSVDAGQGGLIVPSWQNGNLSAGQDLSLTARKGLLKLGGQGGNAVSGASRLALNARDMNLQGASVDIQGASLSASRDLRITATDGSVNIAALENTVSEGRYSNRYMQGAQFSAGRNLQIVSAGDITAQGLKASAGADLRMQAAANLQLTGTSNRSTRYDGFWTTNQRLVNTGTLNAGGAMALSAGNDLLMDAIQARAGGAMTINAFGNVRLDASQNWRESTGTTVRSGKTSTTVTHHLRESITTAPTELSAASVSVSAGNELNTYGTRVSSGGRVSLQAGGAANYYAVYDQINNRDDSTKTRSFFGIQYSKSRSSSSSIENTPLVTRLQSEAELVSNSGGNTLLQGTQVSAGGGYTFNAGVGEKARADARMILEGVKTTVQQSRTSKSDAVVWQTLTNSGSNTETLALPSFAGGGTFSAPGGISVQIPEGNFKNQIQTLSQQPGMGYLNDLAARKDVNWQAVKLANDQWNYSQSGLTPAGAALIGLAVAMATGGTGASLIGTTGTVSTAAANAAFTSLAAQASITLINNKGDIGKTLKEMGTSQTVKSMVIAAGVAGVTTYTANWGRTLTPNGNSIVTDWAQRSQAYMLNTAAKGVLTGANSNSDWWTVAALGLAGEAYQYWAGRAADAKPGVDRGNPEFDFDEEGSFYRVPRETVNGVLREGKNIGLNENPCLSLTRICHGTPISNALNTLPGFNAFATLHDGWGEWMAQGKQWNLGTNLGSMPPALLVIYGSLLDQYRYINARRK